MTARATLTLVLLGLAACTPRIPEGLACTTTSECPPEQSCTSSHVCQRGDAGAAIDVGVDGGVDASSDAQADAPVLDVGIDAPTDGGPTPTLQFGFSTTTAPLPGLGGLVSFATGELSPDGVDDFLIGGTSHAYVYRSTAALTYDPSSQYAPMGTGVDWTLADADSDHHLDLWALSTASGGIVESWMDNGTTFDVGPAVSGLGPGLVALTIADVTGEGLVDILVSGPTGVRAIQRGSGGDLGMIVGGMASDTLVLEGPSGLLLLVLADDVRMLTYAPPGIAAPLTGFPPTGEALSSPLDAAIYDVDGDGDDDIVLLREMSSSTEIVVLTQAATGAFDVTSRFDSGTGANALAVADFDRVGAPEVVVSRSRMDAADQASLYDAATGEERYQLPTGSRMDVVIGEYDAMPPIDVAFVAADGSLNFFVNQTH